MSTWEAVLLGVVQGLTEFLPVSSSGHLVLGKALLGIEINNIVFEIFVHFGTLLAVLTLFKEEVFLLLKGLRALLLLRFRANANAANNAEAQGLRLLGLLIVGTLPAAILGYLFEETFEEAFSHPEFVCGALVVTGGILLASRFAHEKQPSFSFLKAFLVGVAQVGAILPGISRSGTTISAGMLLGVQKVESARFSFLLLIPIVSGATILQSVRLLSNLPAGVELWKILVGTIAAYFSGLLAIKWLLGVVKQGRFDRFAYYCFAVGIVGLVIMTA
ncbi:MAG: undecaprenyl-diphosphate phosphatase [bacterium]